MSDAYIEEIKILEYENDLLQKQLAGCGLAARGILNEVQHPYNCQSIRDVIELFRRCKELENEITNLRLKQGNH